MNIKSLDIKYLEDSYCPYCEKDLEDSSNAEFILKYHKNSANEWVAFASHYRCFLSSRPEILQEVFRENV